MKKLILLAATAFALFSCENGKDDELSEPKTKNVVVQFAPAALSRATEDGVTKGAQASIGNYTIFFLDAAGNVVAGTTTGDAVSTAVPCTDVGATAVSVYVVANTKSNSSTITGLDLTGVTTLATIKAKAAEVSTQTTISSVVLAGEGKIVPTNNAGTVTYAAAVEVAPVICRLEIGKIEGTGDITGFTLEGIYIDNHAVKFNIGGGYDNTVTDPNTNTKDGLYSIGVDHGLLTGYPSEFCDVTKLTATGADKTWAVQPADSKVWAYQLAAGADLPKIIVKLSNLNGGGVDKLKYVTVTSYKYTNGNAASTTLAPGTIYKIEKISFETKSTAEVPNATEKDVSVTVTIKGWEVVDLAPEV